MTSRAALLAFLLFAFTLAKSQTSELYLKLRSGKLERPERLTAPQVDRLNQKIIADKAAFIIIQFIAIPSEFDKQQLAFQGIQLLDYIPNNAYTATITGSLSLELLTKTKALGIYELSAQQKMDAALASGSWPSYAVKVKGAIDLWVSVPKSFDIETVKSYLTELNIDIVSTEMASYNVLAVRVPPHRIFELAGKPFIEFITTPPPPMEPLNGGSRILSGAVLLNAPTGQGGKGLNGEGIVVGVGDNADVQTHVDFSGRLINRNAGPIDFHGTHTTATVGGAGIINERFRGYLPKSMLISEFFSGILNHAATYVKDYNMVITNNSYGAAVGCEYNGIYDLTANILDKQAFDHPYLQHVFAVGNSGGSTCYNFPAGFRTVLGGAQSAKNIISVGNSSIDYVIDNGSSKGPTLDGRIKPEITALGRGVTSAWQANTYHTANGSSLASPAVAGGLGLLYQRYRQLNNNNDPKSALMKALLCNGANDKGNAGPDFKFGFGSMNLIRSLDMLEANRYFLGSVTNAALATHAFNVPANTAEVKVMLYWHDPAASILASKMLVNDLDLELVSSASTTLPFLLDSTATGVNNVAIQAADHTNNIEQVGLKNPAAGNYTVRIKGTAIVQNPTQEYFVVYDVIPNSIKLTYPVGGDALVPGESVRVSWDAYGDESTSFALQYSIDGGMVWTDIEAAVVAGSYAYTWQVPALASSNALVRVIKNNTGQTSTSNAFAIIGSPSVSLAATQCEGYAAIQWPAVPGATSYEVMMLKGSEMATVAATTSLAYNLDNLSVDSTYWIGVRALIGDKWSRRSVAISRRPNDGSCAGPISDNDLKLNALVAPVSGRKFTSSELSAATIIKVEIKNLDDAPSSGFTIKYSTDGGVNWLSENVSATIPAGGTYTHSFTTPANFSLVGSYNIMAVVVSANLDMHTSNDTLKSLLKHLPNLPINLSSRFVDDIESAVAETYNNKIVGIRGLDRYDFENTTNPGRLRSFVNSGIAYSGTKSLTLDVKTQSITNNINYLVGTYNLSAYNANTNELRLDFRFVVHGTNRNDNNGVWIRGRDTDLWIFMYDLFAKKASPGEYKLTESMQIADSLLKYNQNFSSSFQVRWSQNGHFQTTEKSGFAGTSIDDIRLYEVVNDVALISIDGLAIYNCGLTAATPIKITVRNGTNTTLNNIPVKYSLNGGAWVTESIASLPGDATLQFTFNKTADLSAAGANVLKVVVSHPSDNFQDNDTLTTIIRNVPLVTNFPYLQNFESGDGTWFTGGIRNSWQFGTPASSKINKAASGKNAWKTNLAGNHNNLELSYLYSPCFNIGSLTKPTLSFSVAIDLEDCGGTQCDAAWVEYSSDGLNWIRIKDTNTTATNWYNAPNKSYWSIQNYTRWHVATVKLPTGINGLRLRFVLATDPNLNREGIAIDDIHIYDNIKGIYKDASMTVPITQAINGGNGWIDFEKDGALIASLKAGNQNLGNTGVQAYINTTGSRNTATQYYHDRSITIKPEKQPSSDSVSVRFYFLDSETENLINAAACSTCSKPASAYELGVSQYHDYDSSFENGNINDNIQGIWSFINSDKAAKVPFDKGYYVEFKVKEFSEFWLNNGAIDRSTTLPVKMLAFEVLKNGGDAIVNWTVGSESNVLGYEVEVALNKDALLAKQFKKIGEQASLGNTTSSRQYSFVDREALKSGTRYYRLKTVNTDGSFSYSLIRSVSFELDAEWTILPNPSSGIFYLLYYLNSGEAGEMKVFDGSGRLLKKISTTGSGALQKQVIDLTEKRYPAGVYFLHVYTGGQVKAFKLYKK